MAIKPIDKLANGDAATTVVFRHGRGVARLRKNGDIVGLDPNSLRFVLHAHRVGVDFSRTLMIGRQRLNLGKSELRDAIAEFGLSADDTTITSIYSDHHRFADGLLTQLGAEQVAALDNSDYQEATLVHDLNVPLPDTLKARQTLVLDCGTLEHIFDVPTAIKSCLEAVALNGHYLAVVPANNFVGHGFYQFSPEFFYRVLSPANGFAMRSCVMYTDDTIGKWFSVRDPDHVGRRVTLANSTPTHIAVLAQRVDEVAVFQSAPQQSDYVRVWQDADAEPAVSSSPPRGAGTISRLKEYVPDAVKGPVRQRLAGVRRRLHHRVTRGFEAGAFAPVDPCKLEPSE